MITLRSERVNSETSVITNNNEDWDIYRVVNGQIVYTAAARMCAKCLVTSSTERKDKAI